jgi:ribonucleoside-diphosphate reductase beta chain
MSVFNLAKPTLDNKIFLDPNGSVGIQRYDVVKYPIFLKLAKRQIGFFWRPEEVDLSRDGKDFKPLTDHEKHIFTSNIKRQILLDSIQGRAPSQVLGPICSSPEVEAFINAWTFMEQIHSMSYTHIIQNVYPEPSAILDSIMDNDQIVELSGDISKYYDALNDWNVAAQRPSLDTGWTVFDRRDHKKALWLCLNAINALEGIRFYVSFACSWAFAEVKKMEGNAKIIKLIAKDENLHLAFTQNLLRILPKDDPDFADIANDPEVKAEVKEIFETTVRQEKEWARYLFKDGSMIGLNYDLLSDYVEWIANKRMNAIGVESSFKGGSNPLPWTQGWISGEEVQVAPQEVESTMYQQAVVRKKDKSRIASISL